MENINKIQIVPDEVYEIGADKAPVIPEWSVKDDETLRKKVDDLAHSTFDRSKFTVVGSPIITDDGIMQFKTGDQLQLSISTDTNGKSFTVKIPCNVNSYGATAQFFAFTGVSIYNASTTGRIFAGITASQTASGESAYPSVEGLIAGREAIIIIDYNSNTKVLSLSAEQDGNIINGGTVVMKSDFTASNFRFYGGTNDFQGSINLKKFSFFIDGVEVFSGNKTGIDTIKPNNYTVVGTPTISADGVVSGFSSSNYLRLPNSILANIFPKKKWKIQTGIVTITNQTTARGILFISGHYSCILQLQNNKYTYLSMSSDGSHFDIVYDKISNRQYEYNKPYIFTIERDENGYFVKMFDINANQEYTIMTISSTADVYVDSDTNFPKIGYDSWYSAIGDTSIDLNSFKIYVDGNLVYQPCLKIPYTEAKGNKKVVDKKCRDRVKDLFEQEGYNIYYTLGDDDFTLPSNKPNDIVKYKANGLTVAEQRADQTLTIRGACESGVDVNLPMDFFSADSYAVFGVGTTGTNTASKFTPAADGNYIAIGKGKV